MNNNYNQAHQQLHSTNQGKRAPLDKGRVSCVVERFHTGDKNEYGEPIRKNRFAAIGRATMWENEHGGSPRVELELDTLPIGHVGKLKLKIFWDSENQN